MTVAPPPRPRLLALYAEEVRALPRGRFALPGAAALLALLAALAAGPAVSLLEGFWGFAFVAYVVVPTAFAAVVAARVAGARASLFVHAVYTMPFTKTQVLAANVLASLTLGAAYLVAVLPFAVLSAYHLDGTTILRFLAVGAALVVSATALGTLLGVLFTGRGVAAAAALAAAFAVLATLALPYLGAMLLGEGAEATPAALRATHLSPVVLLVGAAGLLPFGLVPTSPAAALAAVALPTLGLFALAAWVYVREQGVETWESTPARRTLVAVAVALVLLAPAAVAGTTYEPGGDRISGTTHRSMDNVHAAIVPPGTGPQEALMRDAPPPLRVGEPNAQELVVMLPANLSWRVSDLRVRVSADPRLLVEGDVEVHFPELPTDETLAFPARDGEYPHGPYELPIVRIPLTLTPTRPALFTHNAYDVLVNLTWTATPTEDVPPAFAQRAGPQKASASMPVLADVPHAGAQMALAGAPGVLACAAGAALRRLRTR